MSTVVQGSLFDLVDDASADEPGVGDQLVDIRLGPLERAVTRQQLGRGAWIDVLPGWLQALTPCSKSS